MSLVKRLSARLQNHPKRLILPEGAEPRVLLAARQFATRKLGVPILLGNREQIEDVAKKEGVRMDGIKIVEPLSSGDFEPLFKIFKALPHFKSLEENESREMLATPIYYACMMLATGRGDALLTGVTQSTSSSLRPIFQIIPLQKGFATASSMTIVSTANEKLGVDGDLFLADCGVVAEPTQEQLCDIAINTALLMNHLTLKTPRVAMLSYSSKSPVSKVPSVMKMKAATALAHEKARENLYEIEIDGELQIDAALRPEVAQVKGIKSSVAGHANVLIFPDLNSGNIASRILQITSDVHCYGQILTGLSKPVAEVSRGASVDDIFGTSVIVGAQAVDRRFLSPEAL